MGDAGSTAAVFERLADSLTFGPSVETCRQCAAILRTKPDPVTHTADDRYWLGLGGILLVCIGQSRNESNQ